MQTLTKLISAKFVLIAVVLAGFTSVSPNAEARPHHRGHHYNGGHYYKHYRSHGYRRGYHRRHRNDAAYLVGGLLLGGIIVDAIHRNRDYHEVHRPRVTRHMDDASRITRYLHRDRYGNCFERTFDSAGDEHLVELSPSACAW